MSNQTQTIDMKFKLIIAVLAVISVLFISYSVYIRQSYYAPLRDKEKIQETQKIVDDWANHLHANRIDSLYHQDFDNPADAWDNEVIIEVLTLSDRQQLIVRSAGSDEIPNTKDDILARKESKLSNALLAKMQTDAIANEIFQYRENGLMVLSPALKQIRDVWGESLIITLDKVQNKQVLAVLSKGPDKREGTGDDVVTVRTLKILR